MVTEMWAQEVLGGGEEIFYLLPIDGYFSVCFLSLNLILKYLPPIPAGMTVFFKVKMNKIKCIKCIYCILGGMYNPPSNS